MSISIKPIERAEPGVAGGGDKKFYAISQIKGNVGIEELSESIALISTVSNADTRAVLYALLDVIPKELAAGNSVKLGDVGSFRVSVSSLAVDTADEVNSQCIKKSRILFTPGLKFKKMLADLKFRKM